MAQCDETWARFLENKREMEGLKNEIEEEFR